MRIAILALQGAFVEHEQMLRRLGAEVFEIRKHSDWLQQKDALVIPGGESTTMQKLLSESDLLLPIRNDILSGLPVFGTCAGLIVLAKSEGGQPRGGLCTMDIDVCRNAYGRQLGSFHTTASVEGVGEQVPMTFIRAPYINRVYGDARSVAVVDGHIVAARQDNQLVSAFHPELDADMRMHSYFLQMVEAAVRPTRKVSLSVCDRQAETRKLCI